MKKGQTPFSEKRGLTLFLIAAAVLLSHAPLFTAGYVQDDHIAVERESDAPILAGSYWEGVEGADRSLYRPVTVATYAAERSGNGPHPGVSHAINLLLHAGVASLVFALGRSFGVGAAASLLGALLFALTPAKSEAVAGIVGRAEILAALFTLAAVRLAWTGGRAGAWLAAACVLLACGSKETGAIALPLVACVALLRTPSWTTRLGIVLPSVLAFEVALIARTLALEAWLPLQSVPAMDNPLVTLSGTRYAATALGLATRAASVLAMPWGLAADYSGPSIVVETSLAGWRPLLGAALLAGLGALAAWGFLRRRPAIAIGGLVALGAYLVTSNLAVTVGAIFAERFLYLPAAGLALVSGALLDRAGKRGRIVAAAVAVVYAALMLARATEWRSDATLFAATARHNPRSPRAALWLGVLAAEAGDRTTARRELERSAGLWPDFAAPHLHLGLLDAGGGDYAAAGRSFEAAIAREPQWPAAHLDLALARHRAGDLAGAEISARHATLLDPGNARAWAELGHVRYERGARAGAVEPYRRAVALGRADLAPRLAELEASVR